MATKHLKNDRYLPFIPFFSLNILIFTGWIFLNYPILWKWFWLTFCRGTKYGVVQTDSPISGDFLFLTIKLNCSDRIFPKNNMWKVPLVSQNVLIKKIHQRKQEKIYFLFCFFAYGDVIKYHEKLTILCEPTQITTARIISVLGHKTIGSHLKQQH